MLTVQIVSFLLKTQHNYTLLIISDWKNGMWLFYSYGIGRFVSDGGICCYGLMVSVSEGM